MLYFYWAVIIVCWRKYKMKYLFKKIEPKWQAKWEEAKVFEAKDNSDKPKF